MDKRAVIVISAILVIALVVGIMVVINTVNKDKDKPVSFVVDGDIWSANVNNESGSMIFDLNNENQSKEWYIAEKTELFISDYDNVVENVSEFHIIPMNVGKGTMVFECKDSGGNTERYGLTLSIKSSKIGLEIESVNFVKFEN